MKPSHQVDPRHVKKELAKRRKANKRKNQNRKAGKL